MTDRIPWAEAVKVAMEVMNSLDQYCHRIMLAGSIRRKREDVKDIELLCIPKFGPPAQLDMFGKADPVDLLMAYLEPLPAPWRLRPSVTGVTSFGALNKLMVYGGMPVDIFTATRENWGRDLWVRTGPADWNKSTAQRAIDMGMRFHAYGPAAFTGRNGEAIACATEDEVAKVLGLPRAVRPEERRESLPA